MRRKIYLLIVLVFSLFYSCTTSTLNPSDYYLFMKGYNNVDQFSNKIAKLNGNSFFFGELGAIYSIWSYSSFNNVNFIVIYKYKGKDMVTYQVYKYNNDINWLKQFNEPEVSNVIFRNFAVLDGGAFYYNYIDNNRITKCYFNIALCSFLENDSIENIYLKTLRRDIIKYKLLEF